MLQISTKSTAQFLSNSCFKNGIQKQKFPIWRSRLSSSYTKTSVTVCAQSGRRLHGHARSRTRHSLTYLHTCMFGLTYSLIYTPVYRNSLTYLYTCVGTVGCCSWMSWSASRCLSGCWRRWDVICGSWEPTLVLELLNWSMTLSLPSSAHRYTHLLFLILQSV